MLAEIRRTSVFPGDPGGYRQLMELTHDIFDKGFTELATRPFLDPRDMARIVPDMLRLQSYRSVYGLVSRYLQDERLRQVLSFHPLLVGGNPLDTTSIYALIQHLEREWGVWFAMGGTGAIIDALVRLLRELGGELRLDSAVERIDVARGRAIGVVLAGGDYVPADIVISNADVATTWKKLIPPAVSRGMLTRRLDWMRYSMSLVVIYFGTNRTYRDDPANRLAHHNIILGPRYEELLRDIFQRKLLAEDFSLYLHMPTLYRSVSGASWLRSVLRPVPGTSPGSSHRLGAGRPALPRLDRQFSRRAIPAWALGGHRHGTHDRSAPLPRRAGEPPWFGVLL